MPLSNVATGTQQQQAAPRVRLSRIQLLLITCDLPATRDMSARALYQLLAHVCPPRTLPHMWREVCGLPCTRRRLLMRGRGAPLCPCCAARPLNTENTPEPRHRRRLSVRMGGGKHIEIYTAAMLVPAETTSDSADWSLYLGSSLDTGITGFPCYCAAILRTAPHSLHMTLAGITH